MELFNSFLDNSLFYDKILADLLTVITTFMRYAQRRPMFPIILLVAILTGISIGIRRLAQRDNPFAWLFSPTNTFSLITTNANADANLSKGGGGGLTGILHNIPGKTIDTSDDDPNNWVAVPGKQQLGLINYALGVQFMGPLRYPLKVKIRSFRYGRADNQTTLSIMPKDLETKYIYFSGEMAVVVESAETAGVFELRVVYNIIYEMKFPVRAVLRVADSNSILAQLAEGATIGVTRTRDIKDFISKDKNALSDAQKALTDAVMGISQQAEDQVGLEIKAVNLISLDPTEETRKLLELEERTRMENEAAIAQAKAAKERRIIIAEGEKQAIILANDAAADEVTRVILPIANNAGAREVHGQRAYRDNRTVTTFAPGGNMGLILNPTAPPATPASPTTPPVATPPATTPATPTTAAPASPTTAPAATPPVSPTPAGPLPGSPSPTPRSNRGNRNRP